MGYRSVRHYVGGIAEWTRDGGPVEPIATRAEAHAAHGPERRVASAGQRLADLIGRWTVGELLLAWVAMILSFGLVFWLAGSFEGRGLVAGGRVQALDLEGLLNAVYFSFVTALSIGYGDVLAAGPLRVLAVVEGAAGLLLFGCVISKLVSRRQEELIEETHRIAFEGRLGRVRTNLHLVLSELQTLAAVCPEPGASPQAVLTRVESAAAVFAGELRTVHDLLYRPQQVPDEDVLESLLASLAAGLRELSDLLVGLGDAASRSATLRPSVRAMAALAEQICGECVPRDHTANLRGWMDRIRDLARGLAPAQPGSAT
jgi:hypothetical protein